MAAENQGTAIIAELERADRIRAVNNEIALFQNTGDARFFWRAYLRLRAAGESVPDDFMAQIDTYASKLLKAQTPLDIAAALDLSGNEKKHTGPKHAAAYARRWRIASEVKIVQDMFPGMTTDKAIKAVARNRGLSHAKVKKDYYQVFPAAKSRRKSVNPSAPPELAAAMRHWR